MGLGGHQHISSLLSTNSLSMRLPVVGLHVRSPLKLRSPGPGSLPVLKHFIEGQRRPTTEHSRPLGPVGNGTGNDELAPPEALFRREGVPRRPAVRPFER